MDSLDNLTQTFIAQNDDQEIDIEVSFNRTLQQHVVLWDNIQEAFPGVSSIRNGRAVVNSLRGPHSQVEPRCIKYFPGVALTVVMELSPPNSDSLRSRSPIPHTESDSNVYEGAPATHVFHEFYAQSEASSQYSALTVPGGQARVQLKLPVEGENDNFSDRDEDETESVAAAMETINITGSSSIGYIQSSIGGNNNPTTKLAAIRAADAFFESVAHNNNGSNNTLNRTQPADKSPTPPRSISGSESGASHSEGSTPPSSIDTATANGATAATAAIGTGENGETPTAAAAAAPEPDEISIPEATSSWAAIFRTLGDLQERFNLAPEETVKMFTEITQST